MTTSTDRTDTLITVVSVLLSVFVLAEVNYPFLTPQSQLAVFGGLGLVLMEAAMARRTVVATSVGGVPEIVKHDKTGILVQPNNVEALASALISLFSNHRRRSRMASTAGKYARRVFDLNVMQDATTALYSELLDRRPA